MVRPTGLVDPEIEVRPATDQVDDVLQEIRLREQCGERVLDYYTDQAKIWPNS